MQPIQPIRPVNVAWEWIGTAWGLFRKETATWVLMQLTVVGLMFIALFPIILLFGSVIGLAARGQSAGSLVGGIGALVLLIPVLFIVGLIGAAYLTTGFYRTALKAARGEAISVSDLFSGGDRLWAVLGYFLLLLLVQIIIGIIIGIPSAIIEELGPVFTIISWLMTFVINGLMLYALPQIVDRRAGVFDAIGNSLKITLPHVLMYTLFALVMQILCFLGGVVGFVILVTSGVLVAAGMNAALMIIGVLACAGLLVTMPFAVTIPAVAYRDVFGLQGAQSYDPFRPPPPPDYRAQASDYGAPPDYRKPPSDYYAPTPAYLPVAPPAPALLTDPLPEPTTSICPRCGATLTRAANFCNQCGQLLRQS